MKKTSAMIVLLGALSACSSGDVKDTLGLNRESPDEFVVVSRPPLSVPPEFNLVPPDPGATPKRMSTEAQARGALLGEEPSDGLTSELNDEFSLDGFVPKTAVSTAVTPVVSESLGSAADGAFLGNVGANKADPEIRSKLGADVRTPKKTKKKATSLLDEFTGTETHEPVVDAKKEAQRLRTNKEKGKPVNAGEVPTTDTKPKSALDRIF